MADTTSQVKAQKWIVTKFLPKRYKQNFEEKKITLTWGGQFKFDAVSENVRIIANISTSSAKTAKGRPAYGKFDKIMRDTL